MSWPLASFTLIFAVLFCSWIIYERARPSARMVAVVATLAAVAALGRDAFVALPDVKPITAMTFVVGYALGPLPGFSVGAVGMLASNIMLGQGTYTPWQMAAWGLVGLMGAAVGKLSNRRLPRMSLALGCGFAALIAKEIMNVYSWTIGASHTFAALLATAGAGLPYDVTDVVASVLFGLAFAPELARLLERVKARMDVRWEPVKAVACTVLALTIAGLGFPHAADVAQAADGVNLSRELTYLARAQNSDGGFGEARGRPSSELYSAWVAMGLAAAGRNPTSLKRDGHSVLTSLSGKASTLESVGDDERTILALHACGAPAGSLDGHNLLAGVLAAHRSDGSFDEQVNLTSFAIFALRAVGKGSGDGMVKAAGEWIAHEEDRDGGFTFGRSTFESDIDDTAAAIQALVEAGVNSRSTISKAVAFLVRSQNPDGGFPLEAGGESNAQSTAWAIQGLIAAHRNVSAITHQGSRSPLGYLESLIAPDGSVRYSRTSTQTPVWVTAQALTALAQVPLPIAPVH